jgi:hypothetical protein
MSISREHEAKIQRALEGGLPAAEWESFKKAVCENPDLRAAYVQALWLDAQLRAERSQLPFILGHDSAAEVVPVPREESDGFRENRRLRFWGVRFWGLRFCGGGGMRWAAAAACVAVCVLGSALALSKSRVFDGTVAVLQQADHCKWEGSDLATAVGSRLGPGTLSLVEGIATLRFENGAVLSLEAPTTLRVVDRMHCRLLEGSLTAEVPESAHGFTVETPDMKVIDWGTKFGVSASAVGSSQVRVFEGEVEVAGGGNSKSRRLNEGQGFNISTGGEQPGQEPLRNQPVFESGGWTSIPTSHGRGRDTYVRRSNSSGQTGLAPLLMVKHSELEASKNNERRALITFDISGVDFGHVSEARILLEPKPSGFGFPSLVPDSRFSVYGLAEESVEDWNERELVWENLPATSDLGPQPGVWKKVGEFWIPRGASGSITVRGDGLADFLRSKKNGLATFLILRETGERDPSGLVHAFASKEHPGAIPPTLQIK